MEKVIRILEKVASVAAIVAQFVAALLGARKEDKPGDGAPPPAE